MRLSTFLQLAQSHISKGRHPMKTKIFRYSSYSIVVIILSSLIVLLTFNISAKMQTLSPIPPTPGPQPTLAPYVVKWDNPIRDRDQAIEKALLYDAKMCHRDQPVTKADIIVESYGTWREASELYGFGGRTDPVAAAEPVWVVAIKGRVAVSVLAGPEKMVESDGVTCIISQANGRLLAWSTSALSKSSR